MFEWKKLVVLIQCTLIENKFFFVSRLEYQLSIRRLLHL